MERNIKFPVMEQVSVASSGERKLLQFK